MQLIHSLQMDGVLGELVTELLFYVFLRRTCVRVEVPVLCCLSGCLAKNKALQVTIQVHTLRQPVRTVRAWTDPVSSLCCLMVSCSRQQQLQAHVSAWDLTVDSTWYLHNLCCYSNHTTDIATPMLTHP